MSTDQLLNEIERQGKYLAALPEDFPFPLFNTKRAVAEPDKSRTQARAKTTTFHACLS